MIPKNLEQITREDIETLIQRDVQEYATLDLKSGQPDKWKLRSDPGGAEEEIAEFLRDVSAFANTRGGDLVYGVKEDKHAKGFACNELENVSADLASKCRQHLSPPIVPRIEPISGFENGYVFVVRVPSSWNKPHMVTFQHHNSFYVRQNRENVKMGRDALRQMFLETYDVAEKTRKFRSRRLKNIFKGNELVPVELEGRDRIVLHLLPVRLLARDARIPVEHLNHSSGPVLLRGGRGDVRFNLDGFLRYRPDYGEGSSGYLQLYRNGIIEAVHANLMQHRDWRGLNLTLLGGVIAKCLNNYLTFYHRNEIPPPYVLYLTIWGAENEEATAADGDGAPYRVGTIDRKLLDFPDILIEDVSAYESALRELVNLLWQAAGCKSCEDSEFERMFKQRE